ncbi:hypothetical protein KPL71_015010 [Citrus sinensis]|uniref:Uncharacterized protein n=1 Tax=Citrus sinensis TaxID=2711 RepID=A0ACB8KFZ6_CITSI|nr:hypothetical protein KPL71_015010 [Citrus sinensis]
MASTIIDLKKFNGDNDFYLWSLKMRAILIQQGLDSALDDEQDPMAKKEKGEGSSSLGRDQRIINNKAHSTIILHISDEVLREVSKERSASGLWAKLEEMFLKKSLAKRLYMKMRLYTFSMKDGVAMKDHVDEFNKLILDLENVNIILEDENGALILLSSLPESNEHFVDTLLYGRQTLSLKDVKDALESKALKQMADVKDQSNTEGLVAKGKPEKKHYKQKKNNSQKDKDEKKKKKRKCYFCQKEGHYIKDCFEKKKLEELQKKSNGKTAVASEDEGDYDEADVLVAAERHPSTSVTRDKTKLWHMRLAYISERGLRELSNQGLLGNDKVTSLNFCEKCVFGKATRLKFSLGRKETKHTLDYIHSDLWGPSQVPSLGGASHYSCLLDKQKSIHSSRLQGTSGVLVREATRLEQSEDLWVSSLCTLKARILISRDVTFDEEQMLQLKVETEIEATETEEEENARQKVEHSESCETSEQPSDKSKERKKPSELEIYQLARDKERRAIKMPKKYGITDLISYTLTVADEVNVNKPPNKKLVGSKWIFKLKVGASEKEPPRHKARLVANGFTQREGVDFNEVFSPVVKYNSIRLLLALSVFHDLKLEQMDVQTAFLHGSLDEEIFMAQPEGFIESGSEDKIIRDRDSKILYLSQADYVKKVLTRFNMEDSKPVSTPLSAHFQLSKSLEPTTDDDFNYLRKIPYSSTVGSIMYAMVCTRPDLAHGVGVISRFMGNPDYAVDKDRRRSITGFMFTMYGGAISWKSSLQSVVALSTTEAEYIALTEAVKEAIWLRGLVTELGKGVVNVVKVQSEVNPADMLTKPLPSISEGRCINRLELTWRFVKPKLVIICYGLAEVAGELAFDPASESLLPSFKLKIRVFLLIYCTHMEKERERERCTALMPQIREQ